MNTAHLLQSICAAALIGGIYRVLSHVRKTTISDKYGIGWFAVLSGLLLANLSRDWFALFDLQLGVLGLAAGIGFAALGILFSVRLTEYSRVRRVSIQEVALLRCRYQELFKKIESSETGLRETPQTF